MAVRFILGRSGTGKTSYCIDAIVDALLKPSDRPLILLVPEQATYQAERSILTHQGVDGYHRLHVLSFNRLQFMLLGSNTATPTLSRIGRQMLVHRILCRESDNLHVFAGSASSPGLAGRIAGTIAELHDYAQGPDDIDALLEQLGRDRPESLTAFKFADIRLILAEYYKAIESRFLDPDMLLTRACAAVPHADFVKGATLWVDGFASFSEAEMAILAELLKTVDDASLALCLDPSVVSSADRAAAAPDPADMFYPTRCTYESLRQRIARCRLDLDEPIVLREPIRFADSRPLAHLERCLYETNARTVSADDGVRIVCAPNERAEVRHVAKEVARLVRRQGLRYRDIAVIASDIGRYQHYVEAYFTDFDLPFFIDRRKPLDHHPLVELIGSALRIVAEGFSHSDVFAYLKTDLVPVGRSETDLLENYCLAFGVQAGDWTDEKPWRLADPNDGRWDEPGIDSLRRQIASPILKLRDRLAAGDNDNLDVRTFTQALFEFLDTLGARKTIARWIEEAIDASSEAAADEHRQFYSKFVDIFDELAAVFADERMTVREYATILTSAFSQLTLAFIPPTLDQVLVGSIERSRHPDLKAVFLVGVTQRQFPVPIASDSILTDNDRRAAESLDFHLAPSTTQSLAERRYLAYIAFTRPSRYLHISYPAADQKGSAQQPSQLLGDLRAVFTELNDEIIHPDHDLEHVCTRAELIDALCSRLGRDCFAADDHDDRAAHVLDDLIADRDLSSVADTVLSALEYDNWARLDPALLPAFFGSELHTSATRLAAFAACPYKHFARYLLKLRKREEFKFEPLDLGTFYHRVLDALLKAIRSRGGDMRQMEDAALLDVLREQIDALCAQDPFISSFARRSPHNTFIINSAAEVLGACVLDIAQMARAGDFKPMLSEVVFGKDAGCTDNAGRFELPLPQDRTVSLDGKIDRVDIAESEGRKLAVVFDYKRSPNRARFRWDQFVHGLDIQLPLYMLALRHQPEMAEVIPVGAFYMPIEAGPRKASPDEVEKQGAKFSRKARGIFHGDYFDKLDGGISSGWSSFYNFSLSKKDAQYGRYNQTGALRSAAFERILQFTQRSITHIARDVLSGRIDVAPYRLKKESPCSYCDYRPVCRFDWQINDYNPLASLSKTEALDLMEQQHAKG